MTSGWTSRRYTFDAWVPRLRRLRAWVGRIGRRARAPRDPPWRGWATRGARRRWGRWCSARRCPPWVPSRPGAPRTARAARRLARRPAPRPRGRARGPPRRATKRARRPRPHRRRARDSKTHARGRSDAGRWTSTAARPLEWRGTAGIVHPRTLQRLHRSARRASVADRWWRGKPAGLRAIRGGAIDRSQTERGETDRDS